MDILFRENKLCMPNYFMNESYVRETHNGGLIRYFGIKKTLKMLREHFYWK